VWGVIVSHALFDFVQLISTSPTASVTDSSLSSVPMIGTLVCTIILGFSIVWLVRISANPAPAERPTQAQLTQSPVQNDTLPIHRQSAAL
jgi:hypothetical protein